MKGSSTGGTSPSPGHQASLRVTEVKRWVPDQTRRAILWSGSDPVRRPRVRWNLLSNRGVHRDRVKLG